MSDRSETWDCTCGYTSKRPGPFRRHAQRCDDAKEVLAVEIRHAMEAMVETGEASVEVGADGIRRYRLAGRA